MADWTLVGHISRPDRDFRSGWAAFIASSRHVLRRLAHLLGMTDTIPNGLEDVLTTSELAAYLKVSRQAIYDLRHNGEGPRGFRVGKELRYTVSAINAWLEQRSDPLPEGQVDAW